MLKKLLHIPLFLYWRNLEVGIPEDTFEIL